MLTKEVRKKSQAFGLLAVLLAATSSALIYYGYMPTAALKTFSSQQELNNFIVSNTPKGYSYYSSFSGPVDQQFRNALNPQTSNGFGVPPMPVPTALPAAAESSTSFFSGAGPSYSTTNIQVAGVDEADVVKTDGYYIYLIANSKNGVFILDADPDNSTVVSRISFNHNTSLAGIYLNSNSTKLAVLGSIYSIQTKTVTWWSSSGTQRYTYEDYLPMDTRSFVNVYDISDKAHPVLARNFEVSGSYFNSRMIDDYVYAVISQPVQVVNQTAALPVLSVENQSWTTPPSSIYYIDRGADSYYNYYTFTSIIGLSVNNDVQEVANLTVMMGGASNIYVSTNNMYLTYPGVSTSSVWTGPSEPTTEVQRIGITQNALSFEAKETVPGSVLNEYSMDEYNGYFRLATTSRRDGVLQNNVYVLDANLKTVGKLENLAPGESLHSARFMGDRCYLVTFKKTDPLFVIDLKNPDIPKVLGELKIPGYSDYLHPYDETHLVGVGKETEQAAQGDFAWYQGLKLSLFDVSNVSNPTQLAKFVIGDRGTDSQALSNPKAFLFDNFRNLLVISVNLALINRTLHEPGPSSYGEFVWQGAYVFNVTLGGGFELRGNVTHIEPQGTLEGTNQLTNSSYWITRALYIDNTLYTISDEMVKLNRLEDLTPVSQADLK